METSSDSSVTHGVLLALHCCSKVISFSVVEERPSNHINEGETKQ